MTARPLSPEVEANLQELEEMSDEDIDCSDMPEATDLSGFRLASEIRAERLLRLEPAVMEWFANHGTPGEDVPTRIVRVLKEHVEAEKRRVA